LAVLHSGLGERERRLQWERVRRGDASIVVGARSAVFAPVCRLGLVVVDEEHEASYKQEEGLRYHAKHAALMRARIAGAVVVLGSATPDLETYRKAQTGAFRRLSLPRRAGGALPPVVRLIDLRQEESRRRARVLLSEPLRRGVGAALARGEQALLFLNRRGFSPALLCPDCGEALRCPRCAVALTLHRRRGAPEGLLLCHHCGAQRRPPEACPSCGSVGLAPIGVGTQRLVEAAAQAWPGARLARLDRDTARGSGGAAVLGAFHKGEADILVGTQMVAKGHHFPRLTVVGIVDADQGLHLPDFRSAERSFQVLTQVAGRAGREERRGVVFLQTRAPHHPVFLAVAAGDYEGFAEGELEARREAGFPPFRRLALLRCSSPDRAEGERAARDLAIQAARLGAPLGVDVLGPAPAPLERLRGRYRFQVLLRAPGPEPGPVQRVLRQLLAGPLLPGARDLWVHADVDPVSLL
jgi:primosomal protein N' (replication factor Y)